MAVCFWREQGHPCPEDPVGGEPHDAQRPPWLVSCASACAQRRSGHCPQHRLRVPKYGVLAGELPKSQQVGHTVTLKLPESAQHAEQSDL